MVMSLAHVVQGIHTRGAMKFQQKEQKAVLKFPHQCKSGAPCCALYHGPQKDVDLRWVLAIFTKVHGPRGVYVRVCPRGPVWRRHTEQLRPRYLPLEDIRLGETPKKPGDARGEKPESRGDMESEIPQPDRGGHSSRKPIPKLPTGSEYGPHNPKRFKRSKKPPPLWYR